MKTSFNEVKLRTLERRKEDLIEQYKAAATQLDTTLDAADKVPIKNKLKELEREVEELGEEIEELENSSKSNIDDESTDGATMLAASNELDEKDWERLLHRIEEGELTPFIGCGASREILNLRTELAAAWTQEYKCPLGDGSDLAHVCQVLCVQRDWLFPKERLSKHYAQLDSPDFDDPDEPHAVLARLPLPIYVTTNYDDYMAQALRAQGKDPKRELCQWKESLKDQPSFLRKADFEPTSDTPVVFHVHGYCRSEHKELPESLVLTEDDYLDFLVSVSKEPESFPERVQQAFAGTSLLFLGYRITDWDFRVMLRGLVSYIERSLRPPHVAVQLVPEGGEATEAEKATAKQYLVQYFGRWNISVYWGTCQEFVSELGRRWEEFRNG